MSLYKFSNKFYFNLKLNYLSNYKFIFFVIFCLYIFFHKIIIDTSSLFCSWSYYNIFTCSAQTQIMSTLRERMVSLFEPCHERNMNKRNQWNHWRKLVVAAQTMVMTFENKSRLVAIWVTLQAN